MIESALLLKYSFAVGNCNSVCILICIKTSTSLQGGGKKMNGKKPDKRKARNPSSRPDTWNQNAKRQHIDQSEELQSSIVNDDQEMPTHRDGLMPSPMQEAPEVGNEGANTDKPTNAAPDTKMEQTAVEANASADPIES